MLGLVDTRDPVAVENEVHSIYFTLFPEGERAFIPRAFEWATQCFAGNYPGYQPIDVPYHDFEHTLQGALCLTTLLQGRQRAKAVPVLTVKAFELGVLAILFHDTGYLKRRDDPEGTGAKYTATHVPRSAEFAKEFLVRKSFADTDVLAVQNMINCTGINTDLQAIRFQNELERTVGFALGTADLVGQMAASDYVEKLPALFEEFAEAARYATGSVARLFTFESDEALIRNTPAFWEKYVRPKIDYDFDRLYAFLNDPYPDGPNPYTRRIEEHMLHLRQRGAAAQA